MRTLLGFSCNNCVGVAHIIMLHLGDWMRVVQAARSVRSSFIASAPVPQLYKWSGWKILVLRITSQDHVQYIRAIWMESVAYKLGVWAISWWAWLLQMPTWKIHMYTARLIASGWYVKSGKSARSSRPTVANKQESGLMSGQACLEAAIVHGNSDTRQRQLQLGTIFASSWSNSTLSAWQLPRLKNNSVRWIITTGRVIHLEPEMVLLSNSYKIVLLNLAPKPNLHHIYP